MTPEFGRPHSFRLEADHGRELRSLMKEFGMKQTAVAKKVHVSQSWISNLVTGANRIREVGPAQTLVGELRSAIEQRQFTGRLTDIEAAKKSAFLDMVLMQMGVDPRRFITHPSGPMPIDAQNYISRPTVETALRRVLERDRGHYRFGLVVSGPPHSGKGTTLGLLQHIAEQDDVQVANVSCRTVASPVDLGPEEEQMRLLIYTARVIADMWNLPRPEMTEMDEGSSRIGFDLWFRMAMRQQADPGIKRLLIVDDLEDLQYESVGFNLLRTMERIYERQDDYRAKNAIAVGIAPSPSMLEYLDYPWTPGKVEMSWFHEREVADVLGRVGGYQLMPYSAQVYEQYGGQPFLTQLAVEELSNDPSLEPEQVYKQALKNALKGRGPFGWHATRIKKMLGENTPVYTLFQKICEAGGYFEDLGLPQNFEPYLIRCGLLERHVENNIPILIPRSRFYRDLGLKFPV